MDPGRQRDADPAEVRRRFREVAERTAEAERPHSDATSAWPDGTFAHLRKDGLTGLLVPTEAGGMGGGYTALVIACEELGRAHPSAGIAFGMHCVATACIAARATEAQRRDYLEPIAAGEQLTTLALSEPGSGVHFYIPSLQAHVEGDRVLLDGTKSFVTNAGHVDTYVVSTAPLRSSGDPGSFNLFVVDADAEGLSVGEPWNGFGMRGNDARAIRFESTPVPRANLLGGEGAQAWYVFEVVAPYFVAAMAGTYAGVARRAIDEAVAHLKTRRQEHVGRTLASASVLQQELAALWIRFQEAHRFLEAAAIRADAGDPHGVLELMGAKAAVDDMVIEVTNGAMTLAGGRAYGENGLLANLLRDARASQVMSPTKHLLRTWVGRSLLGQPILQEGG